MNTISSTAQHRTVPIATILLPYPVQSRTRYSTVERAQATDPVPGPRSALAAFDAAVLLVHALPQSSRPRPPNHAMPCPAMPTTPSQHLSSGPNGPACSDSDSDAGFGLSRPRVLCPCNRRDIVYCIGVRTDAHPRQRNALAHSGLAPLSMQHRMHARSCTSPHTSLQPPHPLLLDCLTALLPRAPRPDLLPPVCPATPTKAIISCTPVLPPDARRPFGKPPMRV